MLNTYTLWVIPFLIIVRIRSFLRFWRFPTANGEGWFFTVQIDPARSPGQIQRLLRQYRWWLVAPLIADVVTVCILVTLGKTGYLILEQAAATLLVVAAHIVVLFRFLRKAYFQIGMLLAKHGLVKWRMRLPPKRIEDYQRWREESLRVMFNLLDFGRAFCAVGLLVIASHVAFWRVWAGGRLDWVNWVFGPSAAILYLAYAVHARRRLGAVEREIRPMEIAKEFPPQTAAAGPFSAGGLLCYDGDNPVVLVKSPRWYALNLVTRTSLRASPSGHFRQIRGHGSAPRIDFRGCGVGTTLQLSH